MDGDPAPPSERGTAAPTFLSMSIVAKRSPISANPELLFVYPPFLFSGVFFNDIALSHGYPSKQAQNGTFGAKSPINGNFLESFYEGLREHAD